jgi:competence protein ComEC
VGLVLGASVIVGVRASHEPVFLAVLAAAMVALLWILPTGPRGYVIAAIVGCVIGASAGSLRTPDARPALSRPLYGVVSAIVISDPKIESYGASARIRWRDESDLERNSMAIFPAAPRIQRGDHIAFAGTAEGVTGEFVRVSTFRITHTAGGAERVRGHIRRQLTTLVSRFVPGSAGSLTLGLLVGDDSALPADEQQALRRAGLSHITAVSGWNVTLVTGMLGTCFLAFGLRGGLWTTLQLLALSGYVWVVGLDPPVMRAAIMATVALVAIRLGRPVHSATILVLAAAVMIAISPNALALLSFQLSVLATGALIAAAQLSAGLNDMRRAIATPMLTTTLTGLATAPVLAASFGTLSFATVPANILAGPLVTVATLGGIVLIPAALIEPVGIGVGSFVWIVCTTLLGIARLCAAIPYAFLEFAALSGATSAVLHVLVLTAIVSILPEARYMARRLGRWSQREPGPAFASGAAVASVLITAAFIA